MWEKRVPHEVLVGKPEASWEANCCSAVEGVPIIIWYPKVDHRVYKSPVLVPVITRASQVHPPPPILFMRSILMFSFHLRLHHPSERRPRFPTETVYALPFHAFYLSYSPHRSNLGWQGVKTLRISLLCNFPRPLINTSSLLDPNISTTPCSQTHRSPCSFLIERTQVSGPYRQNCIKLCRRLLRRQPFQRKVLCSVRSPFGRVGCHLCWKWSLSKFL
jgi:hypothetical protein